MLAQSKKIATGANIVDVIFSAIIIDQNVKYICVFRTIAILSTYTWTKSNIEVHDQYIELQSECSIAKNRNSRTENPASTTPNQTPDLVLYKTLVCSILFCIILNWCFWAPNLVKEFWLCQFVYFQQFYGGDTYTMKVKIYFVCFFCLLLLYIIKYNSILKMKLSCWALSWVYILSYDF